MNKKYQAILKDIESTSKELEQKQQAIAEAELRVVESKEAIKALRLALKDVIVDGDDERVELLEHQIEETGKLTSRGRIFVEGTREALPAIETRLSGLESERDQLFFDLTRAWLEAEKVAYDRVAEELRIRINRLFAARNMLQEKNNMALYSDSLGGAYELLPKLRIPIMSNFDKSTLINNRQANPYAFQADVLNEITKQKRGQD